MILNNQELVTELRNAFDKAHKRVWIAVPFIGSWNKVERIIGSNWISQKEVDVRLITDIRNENFINSDSIEIFKRCAKIKSLAGLHAKVYIIDDFILLTSANLTEAAFAKRYEIGIALKNDKSILNIFEDWWSIAEDIDSKWTPSLKAANSNHEPEESDTNRLKRLWKLPNRPKGQSGFTEYALVVNAYRNFLKIYQTHVGRLIPKLPLYQEIDAFFNYLFHEHPDTPSNGYQKLSFQVLTDKEREKELIKYSSQFKNWLKNNPQFEAYRHSSIKIIQEKLSIKHIDSLSRNEVSEVVNCLHCMNSLAINKHKFLNPINNELETIRQEWKNLIHNEQIGIAERMDTCDSKLRFFSKSSIRELIGWYYPEEYPLVNVNSNSGMKFFGYDIKTY